MVGLFLAEGDVPGRLYAKGAGVKERVDLGVHISVQNGTGGALEEMNCYDYLTSSEMTILKSMCIQVYIHVSNDDREI